MRELADVLVLASVAVFPLLVVAMATFVRRLPLPRHGAHRGQEVDRSAEVPAPRVVAATPFERALQYLHDVNQATLADLSAGQDPAAALERLEGHLAAIAAGLAGESVVSEGLPR